MGKFVINQAKDGQFHFSLIGDEGQVILNSEAYTTLAACESGVESVKKNASEEGQYGLSESNGKYHFDLKAANHREIGVSGEFDTEDAAKEGIKAVMATAPAAEVVSEIERRVEEPKADAKPALNASVRPEDFDWDAFEGSDVYGDADKKAIEEAYDKTLSKIVENEVVEGVVTAVTKREVVVSIGGKSEGVIPVSEFRYNSDLKVGDKVEVYVESAEDKKGQLVLSHRKARTLKSWDRVNEAYENDEVVKGFVKTRTKGGMIVDVFGIEAFLPGSQIDIKPIRDYDQFVDTTMDFRIVKINQEFRNVVVSHKALIEAELEQQKSEIISKLEKGQVLEGTVKNITNYGVFVDLGGVDGLIHITDLSWGRINHPEEVVQLDQKIRVVILDFDESKKRIALGLKQLTVHPWDALDPNLKVGDKVKGKVVLIADYGAFVEIEPGVEGLIHVSEMSWSPRLRIAQDFLKVGDEVEAQILTLDREEKKMSLGLKQLVPNPWENIREKYPVGSKHSAIVRNITNFGVFAELEEGIEGLVHISDISWTKIKHPSEFVKVGDKIDVVILDFDEDNHKLSLGHKQLLPNPWDEIENNFAVGTEVEGTVASISDKGATITFPGDIEATCFNKELVKEDGTVPAVGDTLPFKVVELRRSTKKIIVSHVKTYSAEEVKASKPVSESDSTKKAVKKINSNIEKTTLGDIDALAALKDKLEKGE